MNPRTQIAAMALQGILGSTDEDGRPLATPQFAAEQAVAYADALLYELAKIPPPFATPEQKGGTSDESGRTAGDNDYHESPPSRGEAVAGEDEGAPSAAAAMPRSTGSGAQAEGPARARVQHRRAGAERSAGSAAPGASATHAPAAAIQVFDCEGRFPGDPPCPGEVLFDVVTQGRFCAVHMAVPHGNRAEFHRLHGDRNRPNAKARRIASAL